MNDAKKLLADMKALEIKEGETILVHASMKALGTKETPETVLDTLQAALGDDGTLLLPALTYENVTPEHPVFDADKTVPCIGLFLARFGKCRAWCAACTRRTPFVRAASVLRS